MKRANDTIVHFIRRIMSLYNNKPIFVKIIFPGHKLLIQIFPSDGLNTLEININHQVSNTCFQNYIRT